MKSISKFSFLICSVAAMLSCGVPKKVQYVYVDAPKYSPAPKQVETPKSSSSNEQSGVRQKTEVNTQTVLVDAGQQRQRQALIEANKKIPGAFRGYGMGKSSEFDLAYDEAMDNAYASAAVKCSALVERESNPKGDSKSGRGSRGYLKNVQFKKVLFNISDPEVIKMEYTDGPIFEVEVCLQFEAENIVKQAKEDYPELNQQDIEELRTIFRQK